jgi:hypothetical protein
MGMLYNMQDECTGGSLYYSGKGRKLFWLRLMEEDSDSILIIFAQVIK